MSAYLYDDTNYDLERLTGKTITKVEVDPGKDWIEFFTIDEKFHYDAEGDCFGWIEHIENLDNLIGQTILRIEKKVIVSFSKDDEYDCLDIMSYDIYTEKGICKIDFRNASNAYYDGGNLLFNARKSIVKEP